MNPEKFTHKTNEALAAGLEIATESGHAQYTPVHLAIALTEDKGGILRQAISSASGGEETVEAVQRVLRQALKKLPSQDPAPDSIPPNTSLIKSIRRAQSSQKSKGDSHLAVDHLILGVLEDSQVSDCFRDAGVSIARVKSEVEKLRGEGKKVDTASGDTNFQALKTYGRDLVEDAGKLDPVIGRDEEILRLLVILSKRTKSNPVLIGEPGVGKTAVVEGLAQRIARRDVPDNLLGVRLIALDMGTLVAGTKYRGEFEKRLTSVLKEVEKADGKVILFIDEIHLVLGAGRDEGAMDAANLFKPMLARRKLRCIGATTLEEYRKYVEKDPAFERRFQPVNVAEPSVTDTISMLSGLKEKYEVHHGVRISDPTLVAAAQLSSRYITGRRLPDKAMDLLDEACATVIVQREVKLGALEKEKDKASKARLAEVRKEHDDLRDKLQPLKMKHQKEEEIRGLKQESEKLQIAGEKAKLYRTIEERKTEISGKEAMGKNLMLTESVGSVEPYHIAEVVSSCTGIPVTRLGQSDRERLIGLTGRLSERVVGQVEAVQAVAQSVLISRVGLGSSEQPIGSFLFAGPTGVGKTKLAEALAAELLDDEKQLLRFDMSEYMEPHLVARLTGAPPGYVGYEEAGQLTGAVKTKPYSVVLFDEVDKAHPLVFNTFLQMLDAGRLTDGQGRIVSFLNTVIIMTCNLGAEHLLVASSDPTTRKAARENVILEVKKHFSPELLNRLDQIVVFYPLSHDELKKAARIQMKDLETRLEEKGVALGVSDDALNLILKEGYDPAYGVRSLRRWLKSEVLKKLALMLIKGEIDENSRVYIDAVPEQQTLSYRVDRNGGIVNADASQAVKKVRIK